MNSIFLIVLYHLISILLFPKTRSIDSFVDKKSIQSTFFLHNSTISPEICLSRAYFSRISASGTRTATVKLYSKIHTYMKSTSINFYLVTISINKRLSNVCTLYINIFNLFWCNIFPLESSFFNPIQFFTLTYLR